MTPNPHASISLAHHMHAAPAMNMPWSRLADTRPAPRGRDARVDVLRGLALLMIFVDHIPRDALNLATLHSFGFCDAAEVFVLLAGFSSMAAYGKLLEGDVAAGLRRIAARCWRIYAVHILLLLAMLAVAVAWAAALPAVQPVVAPLLALREIGPWSALTLQAMPEYLDILPLYIVLLGTFPLLWLSMRRSVAWTLAGSATLWLAANQWHGLDLPNATDANGWYFDPFAWQFLFAIGAGLAVAMRRSGGDLPRHRGFAALCALFLLFAAVQSVPWTEWGLPDLRLATMATPDKSRLAALRILDILALIYLIMSAASLRRLTTHPVARLLALGGRHSLEVFAVGCVLALVARLAFRSLDTGIGMQVGVNVVGFAAMLAVALWREGRRQQRKAPETSGPDLVYEARAMGSD